jgi:Bacterial archaeo-eukaryotic release factor family 3
MSHATRQADDPLAMKTRAKPDRPTPPSKIVIPPRVLALEELRLLLARHAAPCVSLYLPSRRGGSPEDRNRYAALLDAARERLVEHLGARAAEQLLQPLAALSTPDFWQASTEGLALFHCADHSALFRLPVRVPERVVVGESFQVRPLVEFLATNQHFYALTLSQGRVSFFKGNASGLAPVELDPGLRSLEQALGPAERERKTTKHQSARGAGRSIVGGTDMRNASRDEDIARYFRQIDAALWAILRDEKAPLVLAGPEREVHIFQRISRYAGLAPNPVHENLAKSSTAELHKRVWPIVQEIARENEQRVLEHYQQLVSSARALDEIRALAQFAVQGRVRELLLDKDAVRFGKMDRANGALELHGTQGGGAGEDVLDDIAEAVLLRGGEVYSLPRECMPSASPIAGTLRW